MLRSGGAKGAQVRLQLGGQRPLHRPGDLSGLFSWDVLRFLQVKHQVQKLDCHELEQTLVPRDGDNSARTESCPAPRCCWSPSHPSELGFHFCWDEDGTGHALCMFPLLSLPCPAHEITIDSVMRDGEGTIWNVHDQALRKGQPRHRLEPVQTLQQALQEYTVSLDPRRWKAFGKGRFTIKKSISCGEALKIAKRKHSVA